MSRDLAFWADPEPPSQRTAGEIYDDILENRFLEELPEIDADAVVEKLRDDFAPLEWNGDQIVAQGFIATVDARWMVFHCSWSMPPERLNAIIDASTASGLKFYDPQIDVRFEL